MTNEFRIRSQRQSWHWRRRRLASADCSSHPLRRASRRPRSSDFTRSPGGKSRWTGKTQKMIRLEPKLVAELSADHISGGQFRHGSRLLRWRTDKAPEDCTMGQVRR